MIEVINISKMFKIPHERGKTLFNYLRGIVIKKSINYENFWALKDINFTVKEGEFIGVIGENGSGKTTLIKIIADIMKPTDGKVIINGKTVPFLELGFGFNGELSAKENIYLYGMIMGIKRKELNKHIKDVLDFAELNRFQDMQIKKFSTGMQMRLAFSTVILTNPDVLLVDEALAVGDMKFQEKCYKVFEKFKELKKTIILVSHDLGLIRRFCDKTLLLEKGKQIGFDNTEKVVDLYIKRQNGNIRIKR